MSVPQAAQAAQPLRFSFAYYDTDHQKGYCLSAWPNGEIAESLNRLKEISNLTQPQLAQGGKTYRFHPVDWSKTTEKNGFPAGVPRHLEAYQFALVGVNQKKARVFGGIYMGVFYIVWFDHDHKIWECDF